MPQLVNSPFRYLICGEGGGESLEKTSVLRMQYLVDQCMVMEMVKGIVVVNLQKFSGAEKLKLAAFTPPFVWLEARSDGGIWSFNFC